MPENKEFVFTAGSHAAHHKGIGRDQENTENRQDKEGEEEIDHTSQQEATEGKGFSQQEKDTIATFREEAIAIRPVSVKAE